MNPNNPLVSCSSLNGYIHHTTFRSTRSSVGASFGLSTDNSRSWYVQVWWDRCSRSLVLGSHSSRSSRSRQLALYYCFPRKSSRTTLFTSEVDSSFESADCWSALSSVGEPDQFSHLPIFHIDSLYFEFRADCSAVAVDLITFFIQQSRKSLYLLDFRYWIADLSMADEPAIPASRVSDAHDAMEGQPDPSCFSLSESGVSMRDGTTERRCIRQAEQGRRIRA